mmetsp:Transcript_30485/g.52016  ORF Transcript_30485/g.52016 Transcript_30485/m.52016 type:complete len:85 (-) Transcript_30485:8-262(-)
MQPTQVSGKKKARREKRLTNKQQNNASRISKERSIPSHRCFSICYRVLFCMSQKQYSKFKAAAFILTQQSSIREVRSLVEMEIK